VINTKSREEIQRRGVVFEIRVSCWKCL